MNSETGANTTAVSIKHTGMIPQREADAQAEAVKQIMAETGMNFGDAVNEYIARTTPEPAQEVDMSGWDAA